MISVLALALAAYFFTFLPGAKAPSANVAGAADNESLATQAVATETFRLESLSFQRELFLDDLQELKKLVASDAEISAEMGREYAELEWMVSHGYSKHALHSLSSINSRALNLTILCPADPLSHVGIYLRANETSLAQEAFGEGSKQLPAWELRVRKIRGENSSNYPGADALLGRMKLVVQEMEAQNYSSAQADSKWVEQNGFC